MFGIALLTVLTLFIVGSITLVAAWRLLYPHASLNEVAQKQALGIVGQALSYVIICLYMIMLVEGKYHVRFWRAIGWNWPATGLKITGFAFLGVCTVLLDIVASRVLPMPKSTPFDQFFTNPRDAYPLAAFAITLGPLWEELFFRGFLYPALARRTGVATAVVLTSLPFGLIHYPQYKSWAAVLVIVMVGVVLTGVRAVTKSVGASLVVHVGYNATLMMLTFAATGGFRHMEKATALVTVAIR